MELLGVSVSLTLGFHPESNGQVERVNQDVGRFLWSNCQDRPGEWAAFMPWAEIAQNSLLHSSTNLSPSSAYWGTSRFCRLGIRARLRLLRWTTGLGVLRRHGTPLMCNFSRP